MPFLSVPVTNDDFVFEFPAVLQGRYRLQLQRESAIEAVSSPIYLEPAAADLSLAMSDSPDPVAPGQTLTYTLNVTNRGGLTAGGVTLTDRLPKGVRLRSARSDRGRCIARNNRTVACNLADLAGGESATVTIAVRPLRAGTISNTATVRASQPADPNSQNDVAAQVTTVGP